MSLPPGLAVAHADVPYLTVYDQTSDTFIKLADPASRPPDTCNGVAWSHSNTYLAVAHWTSPYITIYSRDGDILTKVADPDVLPPGAGMTVAFSPDGQHLAVGHNGAPYLTLYRRDVDAFTKLADVATLNARVVGLSWADTADGVYLAAAVSGGNELAIYKRDGDTFTPLADPDVMPPGTTCFGCSFTTDGVYLAVVSSASPYLIFYKRTVDAFTKLADADVMPPAAGRRPAFSPDGTYLAVPGVADSGRDTYIYKRAADTFTKQSLPDAKNGSWAEDSTWSPDSVHLAIISQSPQRVTIYKRDGDAFTKLLTDAPDVDVPNTCYGGAFMHGPPPPVAHEASLGQSWALSSYLSHDAELDQGWALPVAVADEASIGQAWVLPVSVPAEASPGQGWALAAYQLHQARLHNRWALAATAIWQPVITAVHYTCILTGDADGLPDLVLPISSFQGRLRSGSPSYLSVVVPASTQYADAITARFNGQLVISRGDRWTDGTVDITEIARVNLEAIRFDEGAKSASASLSGHRQTTNTAPKTVALAGAQVRIVNKGLRRYRSALNNDLRPGDTAEINGETLVVREISYTVGPTLSQMEINE